MVTHLYTCYTILVNMTHKCNGKLSFGKRAEEKDEEKGYFVTRKRDNKNRDDETNCQTPFRNGVGVFQWKCFFLCVYLYNKNNFRIDRWNYFRLKRIIPWAQYYKEYKYLATIYFNEVKRTLKRRESDRICQFRFERVRFVDRIKTNKRKSFLVSWTF